MPDCRSKNEEAEAPQAAAMFERAARGGPMSAADQAGSPKGLSPRESPEADAEGFASRYRYEEAAR